MACLNTKLAKDIYELYQIYYEEHREDFTEKGYRPTLIHFMIWLGAQSED